MVLASFYSFILISFSSNILLCRFYFIVFSLIFIDFHFHFYFILFILFSYLNDRWKGVPCPYEHWGDNR